MDFRSLRVFGNKNSLGPVIGCDALESMFLGIDMFFVSCHYIPETNNSCTFCTNNISIGELNISIDVEESRARLDKKYYKSIGCIFK